MPKDTHNEGVAETTEGHKFSWYGTGETKVAAESEFALTYGVKTEVKLGLSSEFSLASKTEISIGSKLEASVGYAFEFKKDGALEVAQEGGVHYLDSYSSSVGADMAQRAQIATLTQAAWILIAAQGALTLAYSAAALAIKIQEPTDQHLYLPNTKFPMGHLASITTIVTNLGAMLTILLGRYRGVSHSNNPAGVLTMDAVSAVFLGARPSAGTSSAGLTMNGTGIDLSTANQDLRYELAPTSSSIIGFQDKPNGGLVGGARLKLNTDGTIQSWGQSQADTIRGSAARSARTHSLVATDATGNASQSLIKLDENGAYLRGDVGTSLTVSGQNQEVSAVAGGVGGSFMKLETAKAVVGKGGNLLTCEATKVSLAFGATTFTLDATGANIAGGALTILAPGGPGVSSTDLVNVMQRATVLNATQAAQQATMTGQMARIVALETALTAAQASLITVRGQLRRLSRRGK